MCRSFAFHKPYGTTSPEHCGQTSRERVAWHQYHALHGVCQLRGQLTMPPCDPQVPPTPSTAVPAWYTKLHPRAVRPNPTDSVFCNQVTPSPSCPANAVSNKHFRSDHIL